MRKIFIIYVFVFKVLIVHCQTEQVLTIDSCYLLSRQNYPLLKQRGLIEQSKEYTIQNVGKGYFPQLLINGQATYQSTVTQIPIDIKGLSIPTLSKDQYRIYAELSQTLFDAGTVKQQKEVQKTVFDVQQQNLNVQLYTLRDRVNQIFFGILLIDEQLKQNRFLQKDLENSIDKMHNAVINGTALKSSLSELQVELIQQQQNMITLKSSRVAFVNMMSLLISRSLNENIQLKRPEEITLTENIKRPELLLYDAQKRNYDIQNNVLTANNYPKLFFFVQGGYGRPTLNLLQNSFSFYYIGGLRLNWSLLGLYTLRNDRQLLNINKLNTDLQKETFLLNTKILLKQQNSTIDQIGELINNDQQIITKRSEIKETSKAQMEKGVITVHEYISQLTAEDIAKQNMLLHRVQLLMARYTYQNISGN